MATLFSLVLSYDQQFARLKKEQKLLDFSDLEHMALRLLMEKTDGLYQPTALARQTAPEFEEVLVRRISGYRQRARHAFFCRFPTGKKSFYGGRCETKHLPVPAGDARNFYGKAWTVTTPSTGKRLSCKNHAGGKTSAAGRRVDRDLSILSSGSLMSRKMGEMDYGSEQEPDPRRALSADGRHADGAAPDRCCKFTGKHRAAGGRLCGTPGRPVDNRRRQRVGKRRLPAGSVWGYLHPLTLSEEQSPGLSRSFF